MRSLENKPYVSQSTTTYPFGRITDDTGNGQGTPVNEEVYGDQHQFFEKLMSEAGITANELPENVDNGFQLWEACYNVFIRKTLEFNGAIDQLNSVTQALGSINSPQAMAANNDYIFFTDFQSQTTPSDYYINRLDRATNNIVQSIVIASVAGVNSICLHGSNLYVTVEQEGIRVYNINSNSEDQTKRISRSGKSLKGLAIYDDKIYIGNNSDERIDVFDINTGAQSSSIGSALADITAIHIANNRLYVSRSSSSDISMYLINGTSLTTTVQPQTSGSVLDFVIYGNKVWSLVESSGTYHLRVNNLFTRDQIDEMSFELGTAIAAALLLHKNQLLVLRSSNKELVIHEQVWRA